MPPRTSPYPTRLDLDFDSIEDVMKGYADLPSPPADCRLRGYVVRTETVKQEDGRRYDQARHGLVAAYLSWTGARPVGKSALSTTYKFRTSGFGPGSVESRDGKVIVEMPDGTRPMIWVSPWLINYLLGDEGLEDDIALPRMRVFEEFCRRAVDFLKNPINHLTQHPMRCELLFEDELQPSKAKAKNAPVRNEYTANEGIGPWRFRPLAELYPDGGDRKLKNQRRRMRVKLGLNGSSATPAPIAQAAPALPPGLTGGPAAAGLADPLAFEELLLAADYDWTSSGWDHMSQPVAKTEAPVATVDPRMLYQPSTDANAVAGPSTAGPRGPSPSGWQSARPTHQSAGRAERRQAHAKPWQRPSPDRKTRSSPQVDPASLQLLQQWSVAQSSEPGLNLSMAAHTLPPATSTFSNLCAPAAAGLPANPDGVVLPDVDDPVWEYPVPGDALNGHWGLTGYTQPDAQATTEPSGPQAGPSHQPLASARVYKSPTWLSKRATARREKRDAKAHPYRRPPVARADTPRPPSDKAGTSADMLNEFLHFPPSPEVPAVRPAGAQIVGPSAAETPQDDSANFGSGGRLPSSDGLNQPNPPAAAQTTEGMTPAQVRQWIMGLTPDQMRATLLHVFKCE